MKAAHITINVCSMEESLVFYGEKLGLSPGKRVDMTDHIIQYFALGQQILLELIAYKYETKTAAYEVTEKGIFRHLALETEDIDGLYERLRADKEVRITAALSVCEKLHFRNFLILDPNGVELEFIQKMAE